MVRRIPPRSPVPKQYTVACCICDKQAAQRVHLALRSLPLDPVEVYWRGLTARDAGPEWQAVVYDLCPWDSQAPEVLRRLKQVAPGAPILLYVPHVPGVGSLLESCARDPGILVKLQFNDDAEIERLRADLERIRLRMPCERLAKLLHEVMPEVPQRTWSYVRTSLETLAAPGLRRHPTAYSVASRMGVSVRTVERALSDSGLPQPKELLNWITLLYISFLADLSGSSHAAAARAMHWRPSDLYRLRHRLLERSLGPVSRGLETTEHGSFDVAFLAFLKRLGVPESTGRQVLARVG